MDPLADDIAQRRDHLALPLQPADPGEGSRFYEYGEMRFARAIIAGVAMVFGAVIDDLQPRRGESLTQQYFHLGLNTSHD
jgi:hypothetical protein